MTDKYDQAAADAAAQDDQVKIDARFLELEAALMNSEQLLADTAPEPLIDGYPFKDSLAWIHGKPGHCKSFAAMEMACCIGTGRPSFGHATKQAKVLYLIAEGVPGFSERIQSWSNTTG